MSSAVRQERFIMADVGDNHNKFWNGILFDDHTVTCEWGRVGKTKQTKDFHHSSSYAAESFLDKKCAEKRDKGYESCETESTVPTVASTVAVAKSSLAQIARTQIRTNSPETLKLVDYLAQVNIHAIRAQTTMVFDDDSGLFKTPLGVVRPAAIAEARTLLAEIADFVVAQDWGSEKLKPVVNKYLMRIPQDIGMSKPDMQVLYPNLAEIQRQNGILDALDASFLSLSTRPKDAAKGSQPVQQEEQLFAAKLHVVNDALVIDRIRRFYKSTWQRVHAASTLDVKAVFEVDLDAMTKAFDEQGSKIGNIMELWHGTKAGNLLSMLKVGYVIPPANSSHCTGRLFGNGVYFSDQSTKSLNYAGGWAPGQKSGGYDGNAFMFLNDVAMGKSYVPSSYGGHSLPKAGYDSTFAKANVSGIQNNEMIVYNINQIKPKYLVQFSSGGR
jgi:poly [ADP-ribose] polymerase